MADTTPGDVAARGNLEQDLSFTRREITMPVVALLLLNKFISLFSQELRFRQSLLFQFLSRLCIL